MEIENNSSIPLLDMICRKDVKIEVSWTDTNHSRGRIMNFLSNNSLNIKTKAAQNIFYRVIMLSSNNYITRNVKIQYILANNNYPKTATNFSLNQTKNRIININNMSNLSVKKYFPITFIFLFYTITLYKLI